MVNGECTIPPRRGNHDLRDSICGHVFPDGDDSVAARYTPHRGGTRMGTTEQSIIIDVPPQNPYCVNPLNE